MKTTVAIINWNSGVLLKSCVESLVATAPDVQLLIIDNHSNDGSVAFINKLRERIQLIDNPGNRGFAGGVNDAVSHSSSTPYVLILNPDVRALPGSVKLLEELMDRHPRAGAIGGAPTEPLRARISERLARISERLDMHVLVADRKLVEIAGGDIDPGAKAVDLAGEHIRHVSEHALAIGQLQIPSCRVGNRT